MDRAAVVAVAFQPPPEPAPVPAPTVGASTARRLRDAIEPIAMHPVWCEATGTALAGLGLDFLGAYVGARAGLLGDVEPDVAVAAFATFEPDLVRGSLASARAACGRAELLVARDEATTASLREVLADVDGAEVADAADRLDAAVRDADATFRPLFAGALALGRPDDPVERLWRACEAARERRGDGHAAVCVAAGLGGRRANLLTEAWLGMPLGPYTATRGWSEAAVADEVSAMRAEGLLDGDAPSDAGRALRDRIEADTDALERPVIEALGPDVDELLDRLGAWSARCIEARAFPPDPFKRAAG